MRRATAIRLATPLAILLLAACETGNPFTTAGSLRVDVEVYKGPLSKEPSLQWAELVGLVNQGLESVKTITDGVINTLEINDEQRKDCDKHSKTVLIELCLVRKLIVDLKTDMDEADELISGDISSAPNKTEAAIRDALRTASNVSVQLKAKAFLAAETQASFSFGYIFGKGGRPERIAVTNLANWAAEYGNQIGSRADALLKQMQIVPADRRELPLSVYLRESEPTDFVNLMVWNRAAAPAIWEDMLLHPIDAFSSEETTDRVRTIEALFADHNWSHINTVYASGQGETSIALIKDDIGNWNLKSFDTDPTELLDAYKNLTLAGIKVATEAVQAGLSGGGSAVAKSALGTASTLTRGQIGGGGDEALDVDKLHDRAETRIVAKGRTEQAAYAGAKDDDAVKTREEARERTVQSLEAILDNHADIIDVIEESVAASATPTPALK